MLLRVFKNTLSHCRYPISIFFATLGYNVTRNTCTEIKLTLTFLTILISLVIKKFHELEATDHKI